MSALVDPRDREAIVHLLAPLARRHRARLCLFGSRARGDARRASDIDIALVGAQPIPLDELALAREALEESRIPFRVDLVDYARAPAELRQSIDREGIEWSA